MQPIRHLTFTCLMLILLVGQAFSATVAVGTCTNLVHFATIQLAVVSSPVNTTIEICPGVYPEQVTITKKLILKGIASPIDPTQNAVVVVPPITGMAQSTLDVDNPSLPIAAQIFVQGVTGVSISNLTVDGTGNGITGCAPDFQGILFQNASGTLNHVALRNQALMPSSSLGGCQSGESIYVQTSAGMTSVVTVQNSSVHSYQKNGITGNDAGTILTVTGNYVQGSGVVPVPGAAQNGIQIGFGATGKISANTVIDNIYGDPTIAASADVLLFDAAANSGISIATNTLGNSQLPIGIFTDSPGTAQSNDGVFITSNKIFGTSVFDAIDACSNGNTIKTNTVINSAESGVHLDASCSGTGINNTVSGNTFVESSCAGILDDSTGPNTTTPNTYFTIPNTVTNSCSLGTVRVKIPHKYSPAR